MNFVDAVVQQLSEDEWLLYAGYHLECRPGSMTVNEYTRLELARELVLSGEAEIRGPGILGSVMH